MVGFRGLRFRIFQVISADVDGPAFFSQSKFKALQAISSGTRILV